MAHAAGEKDKLTEWQAKLETRPGMQPELELQTASKAILTHLAKPLYKNPKALRGG